MAVKLKWKDGYLTRISLTREIRQVVAAKHNLSSDDILINWISNWRLVKYPTGLIAKAGKIMLRASGFNSMSFIVHQEAHQKWYMR